MLAKDVSSRSHLRIGARVVWLDPSLARLLGGRLDWTPWAVEPDEVHFRLRRKEGTPPLNTEPLDGVQHSRGAFIWDEKGVQVWAPDAPFTAEAALRTLFQRAVVDQGGVLVHGAGVVFGGGAVVACGASGAGKSTFARLCLQAGAQLLSDETLGLLPDGRVLGSPFFSDEDLKGQVLEAPLKGLLLLHHAQGEALQPVPPEVLAELMLMQSYRPPARFLSRSALLARCSGIAMAAARYRFSFRKDPAAGEFVRSQFA